MAPSTSKKSTQGHPSRSFSRREIASTSARFSGPPHSVDNFHQRSISNPNPNSSYHPNTTYIPLTQSAIMEHDTQLADHHESSAQTLASRETNKACLEGDHTSLDIHVPPNLHYQPTQQNTGMTPTEYFEASNAFPLQRYNSYVPLTTSTAPHDYSAITTPHQPGTSNGYLDEVSSSFRGRVYHVPHTSFIPPTSTNWQYDLAGVGSQFNSNPCGEYARVFHVGSPTEHGEHEG